MNSRAVSPGGSLSQPSNQHPGFNPRPWHWEAPPLAFLVKEKISMNMNAVDATII